MINLQPPVSRFQTLRMHTMNAIYRRGIESFFTESIPFSYSTGSDITKRITTFMDEWAKHIQKNNPKAPLHIYELGAGTGLLSRRVVSHIAEKSRNQPHASMTLHITDYEAGMIRSIQHSPFAIQHARHLQCHPFDIISGRFAAGQASHFAYMCYLLDALPTRHIQWKNGQRTELTVRTDFTENIHWEDWSVLPPRQVDVSHFNAAVQRQDWDLLRRWWPHFEDYISETYIPSTITDEDPSWSAEERQALDDFLNWLTPQLPNKKATVINWSYPIVKALNNLIAQLPDQSAILSFDTVSDTLKEGNEYQCVGGEGAVIYCALYSPLARYIAEKNKVKFYQTQQENGYSRFWLMVKGECPEHLETLFNTTFNISSDQFIRFDDITSHVLEIEGKNAIQEIDAFWDTLNDIERQEFAVLEAFAKAYMHHQNWDKAIHFFKLSLDNKENMALTSLTNLGICHLKKNDSTAAKSYFDYAYSISKTYPPVNYQLGKLAIKEKRYRAAVNHFKQAFHEDQTDINEGGVLLIGALIQIGCHQDAEAWIRWFKQQEKYPSVIDKLEEQLKI